MDGNAVCKNQMSPECNVILHNARLTDARKISARAVIEDSSRRPLVEATYLFIRPNPEKL